MGVRLRLSSSLTACLSADRRGLVGLGNMFRLAQFMPTPIPILINEMQPPPKPGDKTVYELRCKIYSTIIAYFIIRL